jgi:hypothetical protein
MKPIFIASCKKKQKTINVYDFTAYNSKNGQEDSYKVDDIIVKGRGDAVYNRRNIIIVCLQRDEIHPGSRS